MASSRASSDSTSTRSTGYGWTWYGKSKKPETWKHTRERYAKTLSKTWKEWTRLEEKHRKFYKGERHRKPTMLGQFVNTSKWAGSGVSTFLTTTAWENTTWFMKSTAGLLSDFVVGISSMAGRAKAGYSKGNSSWDDLEKAPLLQKGRKRDASAGSGLSDDIIRQPTYNTSEEKGRDSGSGDSRQQQQQSGIYRSYDDSSYGNGPQNIDQSSLPAGSGPASNSYAGSTQPGSGARLAHQAYKYNPESTSGARNNSASGHRSRELHSGYSQASHQSPYLLPTSGATDTRSKATTDQYGLEGRSYVPSAGPSPQASSAGNTQGARGSNRVY